MYPKLYKKNFIYIFIFIFSLIIFLLTSAAKASECNINKFTDIFNCELVTVVEKSCHKEGAGINRGAEVNNVYGRKNLRRYSIGDCDGIFKKIFNMKPSIAIYEEDKSNEVSFLKVTIGSGDFNQEVVQKIFDNLSKNYSYDGDFPSKKGLELFNDYKVNNFIYFFNNYTVGIQYSRSFGGDVLFNLIYFNSTSQDKINKNKEIFANLDKELIGESGSGSQM